LLLLKVTVKQKEDLSFRGSAGVCLGQAPYIDPKLFIGRESELDQMKEILKPGGKSREHRRLVLGGKGGVGKTQLVIAYANRHRDEYKSVFWLNAASEATVKDGFRSTADRLFDVQEPGILEGEQAVIHVHRWLSGQENTQFDIQKYYPFASHGAIVVTTRRPDLVAGREIRIEPLNNIEESLEILETRSQRKDAKTGEPSTTASIVH
jgi:GTPase SAR1 family protein